MWLLHTELLTVTYQVAKYLVVGITVTCFKVISTIVVDIIGATLVVNTISMVVEDS